MMSMSSCLKVLVAAALAASPTVSVAQACQGSRCVIPLQPNAPPPSVVEAPPAAVPVESVSVPVGGRADLLPLLLLGTLLLAGLLYLVLGSKDDNETPVSS